MALVLLAIVIIFLSGFAAFLASRSPKLASVVGVTGAVSGSLLGLFVVVRFLLFGRGEARFVGAWPVPGGSLALSLDALTALFLIPTFFLGALCAFYGHEYLARTHTGARTGRAWFFFNLLIASIAIVLLARNAVLFLVSWELMAVSSFFLVTLEDDEERTREAGWTYLVASHLGTAFLMALFALRGSRAGSLDFSDFQGCFSCWRSSVSA